MIDRGAFWSDLSSSLTSIAAGFGLGFVSAVPVAFLMAWYMPVRKIIEPWINFIRNIPALAYAPLIVIAAGVGKPPQIHPDLDLHIHDHVHHDFPRHPQH